LRTGKIILRKYIGILLGIVLLLLPLAQVSAGDKQDLLLISVFGNNGENMGLNLYDPATDVSTPLLTKNPTYRNPLLSADGRLAYSTTIEGRLELDVLDSQQPDQPFVAVKPVGEGDQYALAWSPDGHKLAFQVLPPDGHALMYVWDGTTSVDITPQGVDDTIQQYFYTTWSPDGRYLAFEAYLGAANYAEIYVWDGQSVMDVTPPSADPSVIFYDTPAWSADDRLLFTSRDNMASISEIYVWAGHDVMNLSQNPTGTDEQPAWSADGRIAFLSEHDGVYRVLVWDGVSMKDGLPDASTFTAIAPDITINLSYPTWTSTGQLAFTAQSPEDANGQIYVWDGEKATNISQNPTVFNGNAVWSRGGSWAFTTYMSPTPFLYVRDADNQSVLMAHAMPLKPAWNSNGAMVFCQLDQTEWTLMFWDGQETREIARGAHIRAGRQSGTGVDCFSG
jgi:hypothetical protein